jgi:hypothetical protein
MIDADTVAQGLPGELLIPGKHDPVLLPAESVRRILCDAEITDVITTTRTIPAPDLDRNSQDTGTGTGTGTGTVRCHDAGRPGDGDESASASATGDRGEAEPRAVGDGRPGVSTRLPGLLDAALGDGVRTTDDLTGWLLDLSRTVLYLGRRRRTATRTQRAALLVRDRHCQFPGCTIDASRCDAHHVRHWELGGSTDLDNLVLLCGGHHHLVHEGRWTITADRHRDAGSRGYWTFAPPPRRQP